MRPDRIPRRVSFCRRSDHPRWLVIASKKVGRLDGERDRWYAELTSDEVVRLVDGGHIRMEAREVERNRELRARGRAAFWSSPSTAWFQIVRGSPLERLVVARVGDRDSRHDRP